MLRIGILWMQFEKNNMWTICTSSFSWKNVHSKESGHISNFYQITPKNCSIQKCSSVHCQWLLLRTFSPKRSFSYPNVAYSFGLLFFWCWKSSKWGEFSKNDPVLRIRIQMERIRTAGSLYSQSHFTVIQSSASPWTWSGRIQKSQPDFFCLHLKKHRKQKSRLTFTIVQAFRIAANSPKPCPAFLYQ